MVRRPRALILVLALSLIAGGCREEAERRNPRIPPQSAGWSALAVSEWRADVPYPLVGAINLCLDWPGSIEVVEVEMEHLEGGLRRDAYALRQRAILEPEQVIFEYPEPVTWTETIGELGFESGETTIDLLCTEDVGGPSDDELVGLDPFLRGVNELGIQFSKPTDGTARGAVLRLTYLSGGETYVHRIGFEIILCEHYVIEQEIPECEPRELDWR